MIPMENQSQLRGIGLFVTVRVAAPRATILWIASAARCKTFAYLASRKVVRGPEPNAAVNQRESTWQGRTSADHADPTR